MMYKPELTRYPEGIKVCSPSEVDDSMTVIFDGDLYPWSKVKKEFTDGVHYVTVVDDSYWIGRER